MGAEKAAVHTPGSGSYSGIPSALSRELKTERRLLDARILCIISTRDRYHIPGITGSLHAKCDFRPIFRPYLPLGLASMMFCSPSLFLVFLVGRDRLLRFTGQQGVPVAAWIR